MRTGHFVFVFPGIRSASIIRAQFVYSLMSMTCDQNSLSGFIPEEGAAVALACVTESYTQCVDAVVDEFSLQIRDERLFGGGNHLLVTTQVDTGKHKPRLQVEFGSSTSDLLRDTTTYAYQLHQQKLLVTGWCPVSTCRRAALSIVARRTPNLCPVARRCGAEQDQTPGHAVVSVSGSARFFGHFGAEVNFSHIAFHFYRVTREHWWHDPLVGEIRGSVRTGRTPHTSRGMQTLGTSSGQ